MDFILSAYPKLRDAGGFELLKISGTTRNRNLSLIPCPNQGYSVRYLKDPAVLINNSLTAKEFEYGECKTAFPFLLLGDLLYYVYQGWVASVLKGHCPAEFCSKPSQTQLNMVISVFRITIKMQACKFLSGIEINNAGQRPFRTTVVCP